jgi:hypothetical protein
MENLSENQKAVLDHLRNDPGFTNATRIGIMVAEKMPKNASAWSKPILDSLIELDLVESKEDGRIITYAAKNTIIIDVETEGTEPIQALSQEVVDEMLQKEHENPGFIEFEDELITPPFIKEETEVETIEAEVVDKKEEVKAIDIEAFEKTVSTVVLGKFEDMESTLFDVEITPFSEYFKTEDNHNKKYNQVVHSKALNNKILGIVGKDYTLISNREVIVPIYNTLAEMFGVDGFTCGVKQTDDVMFFYTFNIHSNTIKIGEGDVLNVRVIVGNSYDGGVKHFTKFEYFRKVCENGLHAWTTESHIIKKHQSQNIVSIEELTNALENLKKVATRYEALSQRTVTADEIELFVLELEAMKAFPKKKVPLIKEILKSESSLLKIEPNAWLLYNAANNVINHHFGNDNLPEQVRYKLDSDVAKKLDKILKANESAE